MIVVSTDGASTMIGHENGFVSFFKNNIPNIIKNNCVAHHESLFAVDASKKVPELLDVEKKMQTKCIHGLKTHQREVMKLMIC